MMAYLLCSAILVILYFLLALNVSMTRRRTKIGVGTGDDPSGPLNKAVRAHGNASEYIPIFVVLFLYFMTTGAGGWITWVVVAVTACRILHAVGMFTSADLNQPSALRFVGALGTYVGGVLLGIALLMRAMV